MNIAKRLAFALGFSTWLLLAPFTAEAHNPWLSLPHHYVEEGGQVKVLFGWGHKFPLDDFLKDGDVTGVTLHPPEGEPTRVSSVNEMLFETPPLRQSGVYLVTSEKKPGFFTSLEKGFVLKPKAGLEGVKRCSSSRSFMKAIVVAGENGAGKVSRRVGQALELVPLDDPATLKAGDDMRIQVLFQGEPVDDWPLVHATYSGFGVPHAFAYSDYASGYRDGIFTLRILESGSWLVLVKKEEPYPDPAECDVVTYKSVLTFEVK